MRSTITATVLIGDGAEKIVLQVGLADSAAATTGVGNYILTDYFHVSGTAAYDVEVEDGDISFPGSTLPNAPMQVSISNNTEMYFNTTKLLYDGVLTVESTLAGVAFAALIEFFTYTFVEGASNLTGGPPSLLVTGSEAFFMQFQTDYPAFYRGQDYGPVLRDPTEHVIGWLNQLMLRAGIWAAQHYSAEELKSLTDEGTQIRAVLTAKRIDQQSVYKTDYAYWTGATALELVAVMSVLSTLYGWWSLPRAVSMSPLEIAKAFDAPLLRDEDANSTGPHLARSLGDRPIRYASIECLEGQRADARAAEQKTFVELDNDVRT